MEEALAGKVTPTFCLMPEEMGFALEALQLPLEALGYEVIERIGVTGYFDRGAVSLNKELLQRAFEAGKKLALNTR